MASTRFKGAQREVLRLEEEKRVEERNPRKARVSHEFLSGWLKAIATHSLSFRLFGFLLIEMNILTAEAIFLPRLLYTNWFELYLAQTSRGRHSCKTKTCHVCTFAYVH